MKTHLLLRYALALAQIIVVLLADRIGFKHSFWAMTSLTLLVYTTFHIERP